MLSAFAEPAAELTPERALHHDINFVKSRMSINIEYKLEHVVQIGFDRFSPPHSPQRLDNLRTPKWGNTVCGSSEGEYGEGSK